MVNVCTRELNINIYHCIYLYFNDLKVFIYLLYKRIFNFLNKTINIVGL